jgi:Spy/CpxP family protein refolding chaperone
MKKIILATVVTAGIIATSAFAYNQNCPNADQKGMNNPQGMQKGMMGQNTKQGCNMSHKRMGKNGGQRGMQMMSLLNLSDDQRFQMSILRDEHKLEMKKLRGPVQQGKMMQFVGTDGFDKEAFKKDSTQRHEKMMELKASHMEKVFSILTKEQIAELKTKLAS